MGLVSRAVLAFALLLALHRPAAADVVAEWNERAVSLAVARGWGPAVAERLMAMMHLAMFDAVNAVERRYRPYLPVAAVLEPTSPEAAAAAAAATVLAGVEPSAARAMEQALAAGLADIPDGVPKRNGLALGAAVATQMLAARAGDGAQAPDTYRPRTTPGVYVSTAPVASPQWPGVRPFALVQADQMRPGPPPALTSPEWAADYNEVREFGARSSATRSARQTEDARFWLAVDGRVYYPVTRTVAARRTVDLLDSARLFALTAVARADALIAVLDAKYHYEFWRPVTAIRNGDLDGNPATPRDAAWLPLDATPSHPEYPCAHCIASASIAAVVETLFGASDVPEVTLESPTLPGTVHRWTNVRDFSREVSEARIWAGFHYRFSTRVAQDMGFRIGEHVAQGLLQPLPDIAR